jgi:bud emergence protein 1
VLHDFVAERTDELDAKQGDTVSVVAQSNREWFVAKPIGKLGRPGLIPASFVEVRDPSSGNITDIHAIIAQGGLPSVDDWKKDMLDYKANSIPLGTLDNLVPLSRTGSPGSPPMQQQQSSPIIQQLQPKPAAFSPPPPAPEPEPEPELEEIYQQEQPQQRYDEYEPQDEYIQPQEPAMLPEGILVSANVVSFHFEMEEYWFRVHALFQPYDVSGSNTLPPARQLVLFRAYNDFYDFQVDLLNAFPRESGREPGFERVLPYMPGPTEHVDHGITASRQIELDEYLIKLSKLRQSAAAYVVENEYLRTFLAPKPGDVETEVDAVSQAVLGFSDDALDEYQPDDVQDMAEELAGVGVDDYPQEQQYDDYGYDDEAIRPPVSQKGSYNSSQPSSASRNGYEQSTLRPASSSRNPSPLPAHMRPESDRTSGGYTNGGYTNGGDRNSSRTRSGYDQDRLSGYSRSSTAMDMAPKSAGSSRSSETRLRAGSAAALQSPPISASNPSPAFVKIKVFDAATDDLIAVRVHPRVTHAQLADKISSRLGVQVSSLKFRSSANAFVGIDDDDALHDWIDTTDKLVLYAD